MDELFRQINKHFIEYSGLYVLISIMIAMLSIVYAWYISKQKVKIGNLPKKELSIKVDSNTSILARKIPNKNIKIFHKEKELDNIYFISLTIINTGDLEITTALFKNPFTIILDEEIEVLDFYVGNASNKFITNELNGKITFKGNNCCITDFFLNPSEYIQVTILTDKKSKKLNYSYRIEGISEIVDINNTKENEQTIKKIIITRILNDILPTAFWGLAIGIIFVVIINFLIAYK